MIDFKSTKMYMHVNIRLFSFLFSFFALQNWRVGGGIITECLIVNGKLCGQLVLLLGKC